MRARTILQLGLVLALVQAPAAAQLRPRGDNAEVAGHGWLPSLSQGKEQARKTGKPLMVVLRCLP